MQALCWNGVGDLRVERVSDPTIVNPRDAIVRVHLSSVCGSDLHLIAGLVPGMRSGDIIGHEFMGEIVEVGPEVKTIQPGDRVVVPSPIGCGGCSQCQSGLWSLCDNTNPHMEATEAMYGAPLGAFYGYSHALGGYSGSHAEYVRVPFADANAIPIPESVSDEKALFVSDACPAGFMAAEMCAIKSGDIVAVWGAGGVGLMAIHSAFLLGAERVIAIDRFRDRLKLAEETSGCETLNYEEVEIHEALKELTGGRLPDACIDAVGLEGHETGLEYLYDRAKQSLHLGVDRAVALRQAIHSCRKGGTVSIIGVYGGWIDRFPMGAAMNKSLSLRMGQQNGQAYAQRLLEYIEDGHLDPSFLISHRLPLSEAPEGYELFKLKRDGCVRAVFDPRVQ